MTFFNEQSAYKMDNIYNLRLNTKDRYYILPFKKSVMCEHCL